MLAIVCTIVINGSPIQQIGHEIAERGDNILFAYNGKTELVNSNNCLYTPASLQKMQQQLNAGWNIKGEQAWCLVDEWSEAYCGYKTFKDCLATLKYDKLGKLCKSRKDVLAESGIPEQPTAEPGINQPAPPQKLPIGQ